MASPGASCYSGANVFPNESSTDSSLVALLASCPPVPRQVQQAGGLEDAVASCGQKRVLSAAFDSSGEDQAGEEDIGDDCTQQAEKKRRLSFDQVRLLEKSFDMENKLEPERKMKLARDLGLLPRQVAVWFQNRRARWKTKQMERDYEILTADYNRLKNEYDAVLEEKQELQNEINSMTGEVKPVDPRESNKSSFAETASHHSPQLKQFEGCVKLEPLPELGASDGELKPRIGDGYGEGLRATFSPDSTLSDIAHMDSPCTMDIGPLNCNVVNVYPQLSPEIDSSMLPLGDNLCDQILALLDCQGLSGKAEDGPFRDDSGNYILPLLEGEKELPWWDWP